MIRRLVTVFTCRLQLVLAYALMIRGSCIPRTAPTRPIAQTQIVTRRAWLSFRQKAKVRFAEFQCGQATLSEISFGPLTLNRLHNAGGPPHWIRPRRHRPLVFWSTQRL